VGWRRIGHCSVGNVNVDSQHLAEQFIYILRTVTRIVTRPSVTHPNVDKAVWAKFDHPAIMICERLSYYQNHRFDGVGDIRIPNRRLVFRNHCCSIGLASVIDEETTVGLILRMKSQTQQTLLSTRKNLSRDVQEHGGSGRAG